MWSPEIADRGDIRVLARWFAEAVSRGCMERAEEAAEFAVWTAMGWVPRLFDGRYDGRGRRLCQALTRRGRYCFGLARPGGLCSVHGVIEEARAQREREVRR